MAKEVKILVACGSGVATSTVAMEAARNIVAEAGINAKLYKCTLGEIEGKQDEVDLILVTTNYKEPLKKPCISVFSLITGVNKEKTAADIIAACRKIEAE